MTNITTEVAPWLQVAAFANDSLHTAAGNANTLAHFGLGALRPNWGQRAKKRDYFVLVNRRPPLRPPLQ